ncbi:MAG: hypothetical protein IPM54_13685 [Polyangiaceae bacterium]|nr:hypothetical protein [Polyangiaceae bacterium]
MRYYWHLTILAMCAGITACSAFYTEIEDYPCPPGGTTLTYDNFGAGFMNAHCQWCHGSEANDRQGAPGEFIFDTQAQVIRHKARIFVRSAAENDSMPPGPEDPSLDERTKLAEWLACGAP